MAYDAIRAQMDALMGAERDVPEEQKKNLTLHFYDDEVDKLWLAGFSPHDALSNTKSDIGPPPGRQEPLSLKHEWDALPKEEKDKYGYEYDLKVELEKHIEQMEAKIKRTKERVEVQNPLERLPPEVAEQVAMMETEIRKLQTESETLGEEGDVDQSLALHNEAAEIEKKRGDLVRSAAPPNEKQQFVCETSGLIYSSTDNDARIRDLQSGRQFIGWKKIRDHLVKLRAMNPPRGERGYARSKINADREANGEKVEDSGREKGRDRSRDRGDRDRDRDRDRERHDRGRDSRRDYNRSDSRRSDGRRDEGRRDDRRDDRRDSDRRR